MTRWSSKAISSKMAAFQEEFAELELKLKARERAAAEAGGTGVEERIEGWRADLVDSEVEDGEGKTKAKLLSSIEKNAREMFGQDFVDECERVLDKCESEAAGAGGKRK